MILRMKNLALRIGGWGLWLLAAAALLWDIVAPIAPAGTPAAREGFRIGVFIGIGLRTVILGSVGWALVMASTGADEAPSPQERMRRILDAHREQVPATRPEDGDVYATASDDELLDVYGHINQQAHPERFAVLLWTFSQRVGKNSDDRGATR